MEAINQLVFQLIFVGALLVAVSILLVMISSRIGAPLLLVFLGIGIHNFYAGYTARGLIQLLLVIFSCGWLWCPIWIWCLIEACVVTDDGNPNRSATGTIINDAPITFDASQTGSQAWEPKNYDNKYEGPMTMRKGLSKSKNMISIRILEKIGPKYAQEYVTRFGFDPEKNRVSLTQGSDIP